MVFTFDSCIFIKYGPLDEIPRGFRLTAVVLQEMIAGANDKSELKFWEDAGKLFEQEGKLFVPTAEDWIQSGKILNSLQQRRRSPKTGRIPPISPDARQRIIHDVLIARTAKANGAIVVTDNLDDFKTIAPYCSVKIISGEDYFS